MIKKISTGFVAVLLITCQSGFATVSTKALTFDTNVKTVGMTSSQEAKIQKAEAKIRAVIGSEEFRTRVLNFTFNGKKQFNNNNRLTNLQIYNKILDGAEKLTPAKNNAMDLNIKVYYQSSNVVGYTSPSSTYINMNTKYFNSFTADSVAGNMTHEWLHKIGFDHAFNYSVSRNYSVPYAIGKIMVELAKKY